MNESGRKIIALILCVVSAAGAIASVDYATAYGGVWTFNVVGLGVISAAFLAMALMDGESGSSSRSNHIHNEVHVHGMGHGQPAYPPQPQPVYYPQPQMPPPPPQYVVLPSPAPAAPQFVMMTPEMFAQMTGQPAGPGAPQMLQGLPVPPGHATQRLLQAPDGRYLAAPSPAEPMPMSAPRPQPARQGVIRRLLS